MTEQQQERELHPMEVLKLEAERRKIEVETTRAELHLKEAESESEYFFAHPERHGKFYFDQSVSTGSVKSYLHKIDAYTRLNPGAPILVDFNSPGGSVLDGLAWWDGLRRLSLAGHHVTTRVAGVAASMAGILLQAGDERVVGPKSWLHLHEVSTGAIGKASDLMDTAEFAKRLTEQACSIYAERSHHTQKEIYDMMHRQEVWLTSDQALEHGFVDAIR